jgi:hypothetical protein
VLTGEEVVIMLKCKRTAVITVLLCMTFLTTIGVLVNTVDAGEITFTAWRCGVAKVDPTNLSDEHDSRSFVERGIFERVTPVTVADAPMSAMMNKFEGITYRCNGNRFQFVAAAYAPEWSSGICHFKDKDDNTILANMTSSADLKNIEATSRVNFNFLYGTGRWRGVTGTGIGHERMPYSGSNRHCSKVNIKLNVSNNP